MNNEFRCLQNVSCVCKIKKSCSPSTMFYTNTEKLQRFLLAVSTQKLVAASTANLSDCAVHASTRFVVLDRT